MALSPKQQAGIVALLSSPTQESAAQKLGITSRSIRKWLADPEFKAALRQAEADLVSEAARLMAAGAVEAVSLLRSILADETQTSGARIAAARTLLARLPDFRLAETERRLGELENKTP